MDIIKILTFVGYISSAILVISLFIAVGLWFRGILPVLLRLGNGLAKRKIAVFAKGDNTISLRNLLLDSGLFSNRNIKEITTKGDIDAADNTTLFLVYWPDWKDYLGDILRRKNDETALVIYAPRDLGGIPENEMKTLNEKRNVMVTNFRGRLLNDLVVSMITTTYVKK